MKKLLNPKEWLGTGIQLMVFALLIPFLAILFGMMMESAPAAMNKYAAAVLSILPYADEIQYVTVGLDTARPGMSLLTYGGAVFLTVKENFTGPMYLGMWIYAFRAIFKEVLGDVLNLRGLPILQVVCGLFFGALTFLLLEDQLLAALAIIFLFVLNFVLTIVFVHKRPWKKILELAFNLAMQGYLAALSIGYVAVLAACVQGLFASVLHAVTAVAIVTILWLIYLIAQYLITEK